VRAHDSIPTAPVIVPDLVPGLEATHETFGRGIVLSIDGDRVEVDFGGHGIRVVRRDFVAILPA
jgi:hypothetical protein